MRTLHWILACQILVCFCLVHRISCFRSLRDRFHSPRSNSTSTKTVYSYVNGEWIKTEYVNGKLVRTSKKRPNRTDLNRSTQAPTTKDKSSLQKLIFHLLGEDFDVEVNVDKNKSSTPKPKPKPIEEPYSSEKIRLRGSSGMYVSGRVEVYRAGQWGLVCDDNWDLKDATVACRQLGFTNGARNYLGLNSTVPPGKLYPILMDEVKCKGDETSIHECPYDSQHDCSLSEAASVTCKANDGCAEDWVAGFGKCYKFFEKGTGIKSAANKCNSYGGGLVSIDSEQENQFLSNVIKMSFGDNSMWYTGGTKSNDRWVFYKWIPRKPRSKLRTRSRKSRNRVKKPKKSRRPRKRKPKKVKKPRKNRPRQKRSTPTFSFRKRKVTLSIDQWFPGWSVSTSDCTEPSNKRRHHCLVLTDTFLSPDNTTKTVNYLYWKAVVCRQPGGINFICQKDANLTSPLPLVKECFNGTGESYRGQTSTTKKGSSCQNWLKSSQINPRTHPNKGLGDHSYCRNPDGDAQPWCWVNVLENKFGFCDIPDCSSIPETTTATPTTEVTETTVFDCPSDEFFCLKEKLCIPLSFKCDNEEDCVDGDDEVGCTYTLDQFTKMENTGLQLGDTTFDVSLDAMESYVASSDEYCAKKCVEKTQEVCKSFMYSRQNRSCYLTSHNIHDGRLVNVTGLTYFQLTSQVNCTGKFRCSNELCIVKSHVCDGKNDCRDMSDEMSCETATTPVAPLLLDIRLEGGEENSGTVVLTYGGSSGVICDDNWDLQDAHVICRSLGYREAVRATKLNLFSYNTRDVTIMLDEVDCQGNETSLLDCQLQPWKTHDCRAYEIAGVECMVTKHCDPDHFKCTKDEGCVRYSHVCDGKLDCQDGTDELQCEKLFYRLVNGSVKNKGRVEIKRNNVWGAVCDDEWDDIDASVLCSSFGYKYGGKAYTHGEGSGPIWLDNIKCEGNEKYLSNCKHNGWARHDCSLSEAAGALCYLRKQSTTTLSTLATTTTTTTTTSTTITTTTTATTKTTSSTTKRPKENFSIHLLGGNSPNEGTVEIQVQNKSYRICDDYWDNNDASVVCRMLGYSLGGTAVEESFFGHTGPIILDNVDCEGNEKSITECKGLQGPYHDCAEESEAAGVICKPTSEETAPTVPDLQSSENTCGGRPYDNKSLFRRKREALIDNKSLHAPRKLGKYTALKIYGGDNAEHGSHPWQVRVVRVLSVLSGNKLFTSHWCGGVVISQYWVLSAAHCFRNIRKSQIRLVVGDHHQKHKDRGEEVFEVENIIMHPQYRDSTKDYDIALLKISAKYGKGIEMSDFVQPACLPEMDAADGTMCFVSGWGKTENGSPDVLKKAKVPILSDRLCKSLYGRGTRTSITSRMFCAGYKAGGVDTCSGDSGGPLVCNIQGVYTLIGLTSFGRGCAEPNAPGVYAKVTEFLPWISSNIINHSSQSVEKVLPSRP